MQNIYLTSWYLYRHAMFYTGSWEKRVFSLDNVRMTRVSLSVSLTMVLFIWNVTMAWQG
jgi:hypothetical protein